MLKVVLPPVYLVSVSHLILFNCLSLKFSVISGNVSVSGMGPQDSIHPFFGKYMLVFIVSSHELTAIQVGE